MDTISINPIERKTIEYVNNADFYQALVEYKKLCNESPDNIPPVPRYIGECLLKIATNLARRPNFAGYSWRDDMIGDAIETCLKYVKSFDPEISKSPFGYFTQTCWYSFIGRITQEKKQSKIKRELVRYANFDSFSLQGHDEDGEFTMQLQDFLTGIGDDTQDPAPPTKEVKPVQDKFSGFYD